MPDSRSAVGLQPPGGGDPIVVSQIPTGPKTFTPFVVVQYPYKKTPDLIMAVKGHNARCLICNEDIERTKQRTAHSQQRFFDHIISHDKRKRVWRNPAGGS